MKIKREISIAIVVGCIMLIACVGIAVSKREEKKDEDLNIKVYKLIEVVDDNGNKSLFYDECGVDTQVFLNINREFKRVRALSDSKALKGKSINGNYKVVVDNDFIAFDNDEDKMAYVNSKNNIYNFDTSIYKDVIYICG